MTDTATMEAPVKTKTSWQNFSLEDHIRAFVGVPEGCILKYREVWPSIYRVNVIRPDKFLSKVKGGYIKSVQLKVIPTPEGYVFREITGESEGQFLKDRM